MESVSVKEWLKSDDCNNIGSGDGYGNGNGNGGYGLKMINGKNIFLIDDIPTIIERIKLSLAKGYILGSDLTLTPCYIVKGDGYFAHGKTAKEAQEALRTKIFENMDTDEAIDKFIDTFKKSKRYPGKEFFEWHHYLTGSCLMGREAFVRNQGLNLDDLYTVDEFISICKDAYGGNVIMQLKEKYENDKQVELLTAESEAGKEFAEMLEKPILPQDEIADLLKEMVDDDNG